MESEEFKFKGTPGPWRWEVNQGIKQVQLCGGIPQFDLIVMDFARYGLTNAAPRFNNSVHPTNHNWMVRADEFAYSVDGREHHSSWFKKIEHPDAHLIAAAPDLLEVCMKLAPISVEAQNAVKKALGLE
jgi:hypothetical protein